MRDVRAIVTERGAGCDGRCGVRRFIPAGRKRRQRTAKSCGPGAATLALRRRKSSAGNGGKKGRLPGESTKETVRPLRGESRDVSAVPVVKPVCISVALFAHGTAGAVGARLSLRPLFKEGRRIGSTRAKTCRENATARRHSGAMRSIELWGALAPLRISRFRVRAYARPGMTASGVARPHLHLALRQKTCTLHISRAASGVEPNVFPGIVAPDHAFRNRSPCQAS
jgi:hypothetical protein